MHLSSKGLYLFSVGRGVPMGALGIFMPLLSRGTHTVVLTYTHTRTHCLQPWNQKALSSANECSFPSDKSDVNRFADFHFKAAKFVPINSSPVWSRSLQISSEGQITGHRCKTDMNPAKASEGWELTGGDACIALTWLESVELHRLIKQGRASHGISRKQCKSCLPGTCPQFRLCCKYNRKSTDKCVHSRTQFTD